MNIYIYYKITTQIFFSVIMRKKHEPNRIRQDNIKQINCAGIHV